MRKPLIALFTAILVSCSGPEEKKAVQVLPLSSLEETVEAASSISCKDALEDIPNQWIAFRKDFVVERLPSKAVARIAADSK